MIRLFIAASVSAESRKQIYQQIISNTAFRQLPIRWSSAGNLHLTLQFLGDVEEKRTTELSEILDSLPKPQSPSAMVFNGIGCFPNENAARVLYLDMERNDYLLQLQRVLTSALRKQGFPFDKKPFTPHLTLGRINERSANRFDQKACLFFKETASRARIPASPLDSVLLIKSDLKPTGPIYTVLHQYRLQ